MASDYEDYALPDTAPEPRRSSARTKAAAPPLDNGLPAAPDSERTILGAILLDNAAMVEAAETLSADDFSLDSNQRIFRHMLALTEAHRAIDIITLSEELRKHKEVEAVGGIAYIASLTEDLPRHPVISEYIKIVRDKALLRRIMMLCTTTIQRAADQSEPALDISSALESQLEAAIVDAVPAIFERVGDYLRVEFSTPQSMIEKSARQTGIETGFRRFDEMTCGLQRGELVIIAARPSMGKTSLMGAIAEHVGVTCESIVAIKSLEMKKEALIRRMLCSRGRVPAQDHRSGEMVHHERMMQDFGQAYEEFMHAPIFIDDTSDTARGIVVKARAMKKKVGLDLLMVDYLGLFRHEERRGNYNQTVEVGLDCLMMKWLAQELGIPVVLLCQLSRALAKREDKRPVLPDLRDSGNIEEHADVVSFLHREGYYEPKEEKLKNHAEWILSKQRNGPVGTIPLHWEGEYTRISDPIRPEDLDTNTQYDIWNSIRGS